MCGICGVWAENAKANVVAMVSAMHHRGPDDNGVHEDERATVGMARLAIVDVSDAGHQPMSAAEGGVWIVYNGETYNFEEQRRALEAAGHVFKSDSDTEVVLQLFLRFGDAFLERLRGMFAIAVLDKRGGPGRERLLLARDPLGIKPLLYSGDADRLVFASEMKAILASGLVERKINTTALHGLLAQGSVAQPDTIVEGVRMLLPGHKLVIEGGRMTVSEYWRLSANRHPDLADLDYAEQVRRLRGVLEGSVRAHMVSDVPVGAFLSGGIDSTVLTALMASQSGARLRTFSVGYGDEGASLDETDVAARSAAFFGTEHTRVLVTGAEVRDRMMAVAAALDQPSVDGVNSYFVSGAAAGSVKVAISGTGGDESFAGYGWFHRMAALAPRLAGNRSTLERLVSNAATWPLKHLPGATATRALSRIRGRHDFLEAFSREYRIFGSYGARLLLAPDLLLDLHNCQSDRARAAMADQLPDADVIARVSALVLRGYTQNQLLRDIDAVSMAHSLEVRVPLLDTEVVDFALSLPAYTKLNGGARADTAYAQSGAKRILIDATRDLLPPGLDKQQKKGFGMPYGPWMNGPLREILEDTLSRQSVSTRGLFDADMVERTRLDFFKGKGSWALPWLLMMIELWCRGVLDAGHSQLSRRYQ
ncbi:MAG: asparagine synthase (glutamine-hydrolyzing) [Hylemonella sp.]|nr:asparagine synthase (glutamine-hydrolyzing) [bacterium]MDP1938665.1 asparagine synthase (glutamine-hydrolyzing) [Hylemonella sp.]